MLAAPIPARLACLAAMLISGTVTAQSLDPTPAPLADPQVDDARVEADQLSRQRYSSRQQATIEMWGKRDASREQVQEAARHPDPEVSGRAKWILRQWRRGALPDTPPEVTRRLQRVDEDGVMQELLEAGQFAASVVAVEESAGTVDRVTVQRSVASAITRRFPVYIKMAIENDSLPALLKLIDLTADTKEMAVCRVELMRHLGLPVEPSSLLPASAESWSESDRAQAKVLVLTILGQPAEAIRQARQSGNQRLIGVCQMLNQQWPDMAEEYAVLARAAPPGTYDETRFWSQALIAADRCGKSTIRVEAVESLSDTEADDDLTLQLRWKSLANHGEVDLALRILRQIQPDAAAELAMVAGRGQLAFEILGLPLESIGVGRNLEDWVDDALSAQQGMDSLTTEFRGTLSMIRLLLSIGQRDMARAIATRISNSELTINELAVREHVIWALTNTQRRDWALEFAELAGEEAMSPTMQNTLAVVKGADRESFEILLESIKRLKPGMKYGDRLNIVYQLLSGKPVHGFDPTVDFKRLFDHLMVGKRRIEQLRGRAVLSPNVRLNLTIAKVFSINGHGDLADRCLKYLSDNRDIEATFERAESELDGGRLRDADELFDLVWRRVNWDSSSRRYRGTQDEDAVRAAKALVGQWTIARRSGDLPRSDALLRQIRLTLCSPSTETRSALASYLGDRDELDLSMEAYRTLLPMTAFGTPGAIDLYQCAWKYSRLFQERDLESVVRWFDLAASGTLETTEYYRNTAYVTVPLDVRRWSLEVAIDHGDEFASRAHIDRIMQLNPLDVDTGERLFPKLRDNGMVALAEEAVNRMIDNGLEYADRYSMDAVICNNVAWAAAMNGHRLDEALRLSRQAVQAEPKVAIYRDTLAEILFLLGRKQEALEIEQRCLLDDPSQWHLHEQIERFRDSIAADEAANGAP